MKQQKQKSSLFFIAIFSLLISNCTNEKGQVSIQKEVFDANIPSFCIKQKGGKYFVNLGLDKLISGKLIFKSDLVKINFDKNKELILFKKNDFSFSTKEIIVSTNEIGKKKILLRRLTYMKNGNVSISSITIDNFPSSSETFLLFYSFEQGFIQVSRIKDQETKTVSFQPKYSFSKDRSYNSEAISL